MKNPGIDLAIWERLRKKWDELQLQGHKIKIDFHLISGIENTKYV